MRKSGMAKSGDTCVGTLCLADMALIVGRWLRSLEWPFLRSLFA